MSSSKKYKDKA
jgi:pre-rRNA-processing protein TSR3